MGKAYGDETARVHFKTRTLARGLVLVAVIISCVVIATAISADFSMETQSGGVKTNRTVTLGMIIGDSSNAPRLDYVARRGIVEVNNYCVARGMPWRFDLVEVVTPDPFQQTLAIQDFNSRGIKIMFCDWNSPICSFQTYMVIHNMTMIGVPDSHCRTHKQVDSIYRMSPNETEETRALIEAIRAVGVRALILLNPDYTWEYLPTILPTEGLDLETVVEITYSHTEAELSEWQQKDAERATALMDEASSKLNQLLKLYTPSEVGVFYSPPNLNENDLKEIANHPELLSLNWFTVPDQYREQATLSKYGEVLAKIHLLSFELPKPTGSRYLTLEMGYEESTLYAADGAPLGLKEAALYDSVKVAALSVIQSGSTEGDCLQTAIREAAPNYIGASGRMTLDANGDRMKSDFDICGYYEVDGLTQWVSVGHFDAETGETYVASP